MPIAPQYLAKLTDDQRAQLAADPELAATFEAGLEPFLPKPTGVCWSGMQGDVWVPVSAVFGNAVRTVRFGRRERRAAA